MASKRIQKELQAGPACAVWLADTGLWTGSSVGRSSTGFLGQQPLRPFLLMARRTFRRTRQPPAALGLLEMTCFTGRCGRQVATGARRVEALR